MSIIQGTTVNFRDLVRKFITKQLVISLILGAIPWLCIAQVWIETKGTMQFVPGYLERTPQEYIIVGAIVLLVLQIIYATIRGSFIAIATNHSEFAFWKPRLALLVLQIGTLLLNYIPFNLIS